MNTGGYMGLQFDVTGCDEEFVAALTREMRVGQHRQALAARISQDQAAAAERSVTRRSVEGLGRPRMQVAGEAYHYWGQRLGYACWSDKQFLHEFERDNPEARMVAGGTRIQAGYGGIGSAASTAKRRYHKSYGVGN